MKDFHAFINEAADEGASFIHIGDIYYYKTMEGIPMFFKVISLTKGRNGKAKVRRMTANRTEEPYTGPKMSRRWWLYTPDKENAESADYSGRVRIGLGGIPFIDLGTRTPLRLRRWDGKPIANQEEERRRR